MTGSVPRRSAMQSHHEVFRIMNMQEGPGILRRVGILLLVLVAILSLTPRAALADKLVVFKNGKAMKVKSISQDGKWVKCEFEEKNYLAVEASRILSVEDVVPGSSAGDLRPNQVIAGSGGGYTPAPGGYNGLPPDVPSSPDGAQEQAEAQAALAAEQQASQEAQQQSGVIGIGRRGARVGRGVTGAAQFGQAGAQQGQNGSIFQNRSLTQGNRPQPPAPNPSLRPLNQNQNSDN